MKTELLRFAQNKTQPVETKNNFIFKLKQFNLKGEEEMRKNMFSSLLLFVSALVILLAGFGEDVYCQDALYFNVKVVKELQPNEPQENAEVIWYQNGQPIWTGYTNAQGIAYNSLPIGTYDVYVYYPPRPNNVKTGKLLNHYHMMDETVTIMLGPQY